LEQSWRAARSAGNKPADGGANTSSGAWDVERRNDGTLLVRMHSTDRQGKPLPDAVFTFRKGDPQYEYWDRQEKQAKDIASQ
jgi:hypothetical protein